jgi:hypothetical protein
MRNLTLSCLCVLLAMGCSTVANPFVHMKADYSTVPQEALKAVAIEIEQAVQSGNREPKIAGRDGVVVSSPEVQQAIHTRAARSELLNQFLSSGSL